MHKSAFPHNAPCQSRVKSFIAASILALLAGCAVGPNFKRPAAPEVSDYVPTPLSTTTGAPNTTAGDYSYQQALQYYGADYQLREPRKTFRLTVSTTF